MLVDGKNITTIWFEETNDTVKIIDQRLLPHELKIVNLNNFSEAVFAIKEMQVRGAPLIGVTASFAMYLASKENPEIISLKNSGKQLKQTRPTAVNLAWAVDKIMDNIINIENLSTTYIVLVPIFLYTLHYNFRSWPNSAVWQTQPFIHLPQESW